MGVTMAREITRTTQMVERVVEVHDEDARTCDKCGRDISADPAVFLQDQGAAAMELFIYLNPDECVYTAFRRDYCPSCLEPLWQALCRLIGADPEQDGKDWEE